MPLALSLVPIDRQFDGCRSVMFVACNVCPRMHVAWEHHEPLCSVAMLLGRKDSFDRYLTGLRLDAHRRGQRSAVFPTSRASAACLWSTALARKFRRAGADFDAIGVVGCESAVKTVSQVFPDKRIVQLVSVEGIANFTLRTAWPLTVEITAAAQIPREGHPCRRLACHRAKTDGGRATRRDRMIGILLQNAARFGPPRTPVSLAPWAARSRARAPHSGVFGVYPFRSAFRLVL